MLKRLFFNRNRSNNLKFDTYETFDWYLITTFSTEMALDVPF